MAVYNYNLIDGGGEMRIAVIGSRSICTNISEYIPQEITELVSGGAIGVDAMAEKYADERMMPKLILKPDYARYGSRAPLICSKLIVEAADMIVAIWDGKSNGTRFIINYARSLDKPVIVHTPKTYG